MSSELAAFFFNDGNLINFDSCTKMTSKSELGYIHYLR